MRGRLFFWALTAALAGFLYYAPNRHRAQGQSLGSFTHWTFAALLTLVFPVATNRSFPPAARLQPRAACPRGVLLSA